MTGDGKVRKDLCVKVPFEGCDAAAVRVSGGRAFPAEGTVHA